MWDYFVCICFSCMSDWVIALKVNSTQEKTTSVLRPLHGCTDTLISFCLLTYLVVCKYLNNILVWISRVSCHPVYIPNWSDYTGMRLLQLQKISVS